MISKNILFIFLLWSFISCKEQCSCDFVKTTYISKNITSDTCLMSNVYRKVFSQNKVAIPSLIDSIAINKIGQTGFIDPMSSFLYPYTFSNQIGINYAYLIELILTKDTIEHAKKTWDINQNISHWKEIVEPYRIYQQGTIVRKDNNDRPILEALTHNDMLIIKEIYSKWWDINKNKSIGELRDDRRKELHILRDPYIWI